MCDMLISSGNLTCEADFCPGCGQQAGQCDQTCALPCTSGHRLLGENMFHGWFEQPPQCRWDDIDDMATSVEAECCPGG